MSASGSKGARREHVKKLRAAARECGVAPTDRDDVGKDKVVAMMASIRASAGPAARKQAAEAAFKNYEACFAKGSAPEDGTQQPKPKQAFRLRGKSFLLCYNWLFLEKPFPDGTPPAKSVEDLWQLWQEWKRAKKTELGVFQSTSALEESLESPDENRVHFHWKINLEKPLDQENTECLWFHGVKPDARPTLVAAVQEGKKARGANFWQASNIAHFYAWVWKHGKLRRAANYRPFDDYRVMGKWLDDLWTDGKLGHDVYEEMATRVRVGFSTRKRDLELVKAAEEEAKVDKEICEVDAELDKIRAPPRVFAVVAAWEDTYLELRFRWNLLVLVADSAAGKSSFAETRFDNPYILTVEDAEQLDLKSFERRKHDGIVLDNVNSWGQLLSWRAILQARNAKSRGRQSATNVYSYVQYLFGVPIIATIDLDAPDAYLVDPSSDKRSKWLCKNCTILRLPPGETFYKKDRVPKVKVPNTFSLFAKTLAKRRRAASGGSPP